MPKDEMREQLDSKLKTIGNLGSSLEKMLSFTGFMDVNEMAKEMFQVLGLLEIYSAAYMESDVYFSRTAQNAGGVALAPRDRLICYLQMIKNLKKASSSTYVNSGQSTNLDSQANFENLDFLDQQDLQKLKGLKINDNFITKLVEQGAGLRK